VPATSILCWSWAICFPAAASSEYIKNQEKASGSDESVELTSHLQVSFEFDIGQATGGDGLGRYEAFKPMASNLISNIAYVEGSVRSVNSRLRHPTRCPGNGRRARHTSL